MNSTEQAQQFKFQGNYYFGVAQYHKAITLYNQAISLTPKDTLLYSNRALCFKKLKNYVDALKDCDKAISVDSTNFKAYLIEGQIQLDQSKYIKNDGYFGLNLIESGIANIKKALQISLDKGKANEKFIQDIEIFLKRAERLKWHKTQEKKLYDLKMLINLMKQQNPPYSQRKIHENIVNRIQSKIQKIENFRYDNVPEYLQCPIDFDIYNEPYIISTGQTYNYTSICQHFKRNNHTCPMTRQPIKKYIVKNYPLKQQIADYTNQNPWAYEVIQCPSYTQLQF